jgi:hypothetical protein
MLDPFPEPWQPSLDFLLEHHHYTQVRRGGRQALYAADPNGPRTAADRAGLQA